MQSKVCIFLLSALISGVVSVTQNGNLSFNRAGNPYKDMKVVLPFWEAWRHCEKHGLQLPSITSEEDANQFLLAISADIDGPWWIGGVDLGEKPGSFVWIHNVQPVENPNGYTNWGPGEPNNGGGIERCLMFHPWYLPGKIEPSHKPVRGHENLLSFWAAWRYCESQGIPMPQITSDTDFNNYRLATSADMNGNCGPEESIWDQRDRSCGSST
ncbi:lactose-binding lectin l-2-like [Uranotaenia lowii]|uniref:lactose-binding lectin l-2-like n=1 Tax=Uranotaenia lowii TaxID=190385 RepID=UPI00247A7062|nr:lactose-binding lectin l-2-like [Uranotaenia lowii]